MKKNIQKPENWQDFESLCKHLWGEIWGIPNEIKKNGRDGQEQNGVDIYGIPKDQNQYYGIQCKNRRNDLKSKLTTKDIEDEINRAKLFKPQLKVFIIATTMNKDVKLEEFVRTISCENITHGGFEIQLFCWEDIADLIEKYKGTYSYWVLNKVHTNSYQFKVHFEGLKNELIIKPQFIRKIRKYRIRKDVPNKSNKEFDFSEIHRSMNHKCYNTQLPLHKSKVNLSICSFNLCLVNSGSDVIEDWKVLFNFDGELSKLFEPLLGSAAFPFDLKVRSSSNISIDKNIVSYSDDKTLPLVQKDSRNFRIGLIPYKKEYTIPIEWKLIARDFNTNGKLILNVKPNYDDVYEYVDVQNELEVKDEEILSVEYKFKYSD
jgi:hypothetical protein